MIKILFQKLYDFFITPFVKAFHWLYRTFSGQTPSPPPKKNIQKDKDAETQREALIEAEVQRRLQAERAAEARRKAGIQAELEALKEARLKAEEARRIKAQEERAKAREEQERIRSLEQAEAQRIKVLENAEKEAEENNRETLYQAISEGNVSLAETCLDCLKKTKPEEILKEPSKLLYKAIKSGHIEIIKLLMQYKVSLKFECAESEYSMRASQSALSLAVDANHLHIVKFLLEQGLPITWDAINVAHGKRADEKRGRKENLYKNTENSFALFLNTNTVTFQPDLKDSNQFYYFLSAIEEGHIGTLKRTLDNLDVNQTTIYRYIDARCASIIELAILYGQTEAAKLLISYHQAHRDSFELKRDIHNVYDAQGIFYWALKYNNIEIAKIFIKSPKINLNFEYPADDVTKRYYPAALYHAMSHKNLEMADLLIDAGATLGDCHYPACQLDEINEYKKHITPLYDKELECLHVKNGIPKTVLPIIRDYVAPYVEPTEANQSGTEKPVP